jgi:hypothetical protein
MCSIRHSNAQHQAQQVKHGKKVLVTNIVMTTCARMGAGMGSDRQHQQLNARSRQQAAYQ